LRKSKRKSNVELSNGSFDSNTVMTILEFEKQLEEEYGKEKLEAALRQLEEDHGDNGFDLYLSGEFDILLDIIKDIDPSDN